MTRLTVRQVARISGVSVRTLHHYDQIGLLKPAYTGENRYRYYGERELLRLQQILFHREFGIPLAEIAVLLDDPQADPAGILLGHRARLVAEAERYRRLIRTIDRTIAALKGDRVMKHAELYQGFSPAKQAEYEDWLTQYYGDGVKPDIARGNAHLAALSADAQATMMAELAECEQALADELRRGVAPDAMAMEPLLARHRRWVGAMWDRPCAAEAYAGLADLYLSHPDFVARYETIEPGFAAFLTAAMKAHAARHSE